MVVTFLVTDDYAENATILNSSRLGKQRLEAKQIIIALEEGSGWVNHPATKSWSGHIDSLKLYYNAIVTEWVKRGYNNNMPLYDLPPPEEIIHPPWIFEKPIQFAMMSQLIQKDSEFYSVENLKSKISPVLLHHFKSLPPIYLKFGYIWPCKYTIEEIRTLPLAQLAEPFQQRIFCDQNCHNKALYITRSGTITKRCGVHRDKSIPITKCSASYKNGNPCRNKALYGEEKCGVHSRK